MRCKNCNSPISEGDQFCRKCGHRSPLAEQKDKISALRERLSDVLVEKTRSPILLIIAIIFTLMTLAKPLNLIYMDALSLVEGAFMIIATVGLWMTFAVKSKRKISVALRLASIHDAYVRILYTVLILIASTLVIGGAIAAFVIAGILAVSGVENLASELAPHLISVGIFVLIVGGVIVLLLLFVRSVFASRREYFVRLSHLSDDGEYKVNKAPSLTSFILGGAACFIGVTSLLGSVFMTGLATGLIVMVAEFFGLGEYIGVDMSGITNIPIIPDANSPTIGDLWGLDGFLSLDDLGIFDRIAEIVGGYINYFSSIISIVLFVLGILALVFGIYFILSGAFVSSVHNEAKRRMRELDAECALYDGMLREMREESKAKAAEQKNFKKPDEEPKQLLKTDQSHISTEEKSVSEGEDSEKIEEPLHS